MTMQHVQEIETKKYNGWTNYETWAVNLWLGNDKGNYTYWQERAAYWKTAKSTSEYWSQAESATFNLADELEQAFKDNQPETVNGTVYADLLNAALSEVNWHEIAEGLLTD